MKISDEILTDLDDINEEIRLLAYENQEMAYVLSKLGVSNEDLSNIIINGSKKEKDSYIEELKKLYKWEMGGESWEY